MKASKFTHSREVRELTVTFGVADTGTTYEMFMLPKNARILGWLLSTKTAFTGGTLTITANNTTLVNAYTLPTATGTEWLTGAALSEPGYNTPTLATVRGALAGATGTDAELDITCLFTLAQGTKLN